MQYHDVSLAKDFNLTVEKQDIVLKKLSQKTDLALTDKILKKTDIALTQQSLAKCGALAL